MEGLFKTKPVPLSDTVYSETRDNMQEARKTKDWKWYGDTCIEAHAILVEAGVLKPNQQISVTRFPTLLWHCHLDAQVSEEDNE